MNNKQFMDAVYDYLEGNEDGVYACDLPMLVKTKGGRHWKIPPSRKGMVKYLKKDGRFELNSKKYGNVIVKRRTD